MAAIPTHDDFMLRCDVFHPSLCGNTAASTKDISQSVSRACREELGQHYGCRIIAHKEPRVTSLRRKRYANISSFRQTYESLRMLVWYGMANSEGLREGSWPASPMILAATERGLGERTLTFLAFEFATLEDTLALFIRSAGWVMSERSGA